MRRTCRGDSAGSNDRRSTLDWASLVVLCLCLASLIAYVTQHLGEVRAIISWISFDN